MGYRTAALALLTGAALLAPVAATAAPVLPASLALEGADVVLRVQSTSVQPAKTAPGAAVGFLNELPALELSPPPSLLGSGKVQVAVDLLLRFPEGDVLLKPQEHYVRVLPSPCSGCTLSYRYRPLVPSSLLPQLEPLLRQLPSLPVDVPLGQLLELVEDLTQLPLPDLTLPDLPVEVPDLDGILDELLPGTPPAPAAPPLPPGVDGVPYTYRLGFSPQMSAVGGSATPAYPRD